MKHLTYTFILLFTAATIFAEIPDHASPPMPSLGTKEYGEWLVLRIYAVHGGTWGKDYWRHDELEEVGQCGTVRRPPKADDQDDEEKVDDQGNDEGISENTAGPAIAHEELHAPLPDDDRTPVVYKDENGNAVDRVYLDETAAEAEDETKLLAQGCYVGCQMGPYYRVWGETGQIPFDYLDQKTVDDIREAYADLIAEREATTPDENLSGDDKQLVERYSLEMLAQCYINMGFKLVFNNTNVPFLPQISERSIGQDYKPGDVIIQQWGEGKSVSKQEQESNEAANESPSGYHPPKSRTTSHWEGVTLQGEQYSGGSGCFGFNDSIPSPDGMRVIVLEWPGKGNIKTPDEAAAARGTKRVGLKAMEQQPGDYVEYDCSPETFQNMVHAAREIAMKALKKKLAKEKEDKKEKQQKENTDV